MEIMDRIIGLWMVILGGVLFVFAHMLEPYMDTVSGYVLYVVAIPTAIFLAVSIGSLVVFGMAQAAGTIAIRAETRKLI